MSQHHSSNPQPVVVYTEDAMDQALQARMRARVTIMAESPPAKASDSQSSPLPQSSGGVTFQISAHHTARIMLDEGSPAAAVAPSRFSSNAAALLEVSTPSPPAPVPADPASRPVLLSQSLKRIAGSAAAAVTQHKRRTVEPAKPKPAKPPSAVSSKSLFEDWPDAARPRRPVGGAGKPSKPAAKPPPAKPAPRHPEHELRPVSEIFSQVKPWEDAKHASQQQPHAAAGSTDPQQSQQAFEDPLDDAWHTPDRKPAAVGSGSSDRGHFHAFRTDVSHAGFLGLVHSARAKARQALTDFALRDGEAAADGLEDVVTVEVCGSARRDELHYAIPCRAVTGLQSGCGGTITLVVPCVFTQETRANSLRRMQHVGFLHQPQLFSTGARLAVHTPYLLVADNVLVCSGLVTFV